jgi:hypothetical protein
MNTDIIPEGRHSVGKQYKQSVHDGVKGVKT